MSERPPWDPQRAAFWLIAFVIGVDALVVVAALAVCAWHSHLILASPEIKCDPEGRIFQLLSAALSAALAMAGLRSNK